MRRLVFAAIVLALTGCLSFEEAGKAFCLDNPRCADGGGDSGTPGSDAGEEGDGGWVDSGTQFPDASYPNHSSWDDFGGSTGTDVRGISARSNGSVMLFGNVRGATISFDEMANVSDDYGFVFSVGPDGAPNPGTFVVPGLEDAGTTPVTVTATRETSASKLLVAINTTYGRTLCFNNEAPRGTSVQEVTVGVPSSCTTVLSMQVKSAEITAMETPAGDPDLVAYAGWYKTQTGTTGQVTLPGQTATLPPTEGDSSRGFFAVRTQAVGDPFFVHPTTTETSQCNSAFTDLRLLQSNQLLIAGHYSGFCHFGDDLNFTPVTADSGVPVAFAARFDLAERKIAFLRTLGEADPAPVRLAVTSSSRMVVGYTQDGDLKLVELDLTSGDETGALALTPSATTEKLTGLAAAADGAVWVTGTFSHDVPNTPVEFGPGAVLLTGQGKPEGFVLKCKLGTPCSRAYAYRSDGAVEPTGITVIGSNVHVTGNFRGSFWGGDNVSLATDNVDHQLGFHIIFADPDFAP